MKNNPTLPRAPSPRRYALAAVLCLLATRVIITAQAAEPYYHFGVQTHFAQGWNQNLMPLIPAAGIVDVRDELYWQLVEPTAGKFTFPPNYDTYMTTLRNLGIAPLITLSFENTNYDSGQTPYSSGALDAYARYAKNVLARYGNQISAVEIWNEYNGSFAKGPAASDRSGNYLKMLKAVYPAIKSARPEVTVVAGATAGVPLPYFEKLFAAGALDYLDVVSVHPYRTTSTPEGIEVQIAALRALMARYGQVKPIWVTEIGWPLRPSAAKGDLQINETVQAQFLTRSFALLMSAGVPRIYWYAMRDESAYPNMGLVLNNSGLTSRKAYAAMKTLNTHLRYARFEARERTAADVYSLRFSNQEGREVRVLWALSPQTISIPSGTTVTNFVGEPLSSGVISVNESPVFVSGPLPGLMGAETARASNAATSLTDSVASFSLQQDQYGWQYGYFVGSDTKFAPLQNKRVTDWKEEWGDRFVSISATNVDQHPSKSGNQPVSVVRRWTSNVDGEVRISAHFKVGLKGDGVRVRILADGQVLQSATLSTGTSITADYNFVQRVRTGTTLDFAVDPGPAASIDYDVTQTSITIERVY